MNRKQRRKSGKTQADKRGKEKRPGAVPPAGEFFSNSGVSSLLIRNAGIQPEMSDPGSVEFMLSMAKNHHQAGRLDQAEETYRQILRLSARHAASLHLLGLVMHQRGHSSEALELIGASIKENSRDPESQNNMGNVLRRLGRAPEAIEYFAKAVKLAPGFAGAYSNLGLTYRQLGKFKEATEQFRHAIKHDPFLAEAWGGLAKVGRLSLKDEEIEAAENVLKHERLSDSDRRLICFALGKSFDAAQQWDKAFHYYERANNLSEVSPNKGASRGLLKAMLSQPFLQPDVAPERGAPDPASFVPIFIFGMPRSGTTLVEQILASHPDVSSGGETNTIESEVRQMFPELGSGDASVLAGMTPSQVDRLTAAFSAVVQRFSNSKARHPVFFTDKSLLNFMYLPIIIRAFPGARLVHCRRNPIDTCLSVYFTDFKAIYDYASDLDEIGQFYCLYHQIMAKWEATLPGRILDIHYENILDDQEGSTRRMLEFCDLSWDPACMKFHETDRQVSTPSDWQVRLPIFSSSRDRWKHYKKHLSGLLRSLEPCI